VKNHRREGKGNGKRKRKRETERAIIKKGGERKLKIERKF
jgi:hypothetical protein